ncbi:hypothetical protein UCRPC4_g06919 [Phaeomoniella chlamydospora]|uniref:Aminoglycoside phosphotransferase domain-containing protein n=1 Tax=Phaeomoniella chlamydospora TaxID=158046 RepID=A0A0G2DSQ9_PHACM|nr:hypothetical protein UCRPC4_g06919 [Phaeomoniella chlamydospora]
MLSPFLKNEFHTGLRVGYLLMDYIQDGEMLSETFKDRKGDEDLQSNLFTDLSRILLSLAKIPQPRIGSFTFEDDGRITLSNRPLTLQLHMLENEKVPTNIGRKTTYSSVADYIYDLLGYHDSRLLHQPNSMDNEDDGRRQMGAISLMRATSVHFINLETRHGPFYFTLTDLHQSNIFVDQDWHVKSIIDLEWACSLPSEMLQPPYWITDEPIDHLTGENLEKFSKVRDKFMSIFEREEKLYTHTNQAPRTRMMQKNWETGSFWYFAALESTKGLYNIFRRNIRPKFSENFSYQEVSHYWRTNTDKVIQAKLDDRQSYRDNLIQRAMKGRELSEGESAERKKALREREL